MKYGFLYFVLIINSVTLGFGQDYFVLLDSTNSYGIIDIFGKRLLDFKYTQVIDKNYCLLVTDKNNKKGIISKNITEILPFEFEEINMNCSDWIIAKKNGCYGYYDTIGNLKLPHKYRDASFFKNNLALVMFEDSIEIKLVWIDRHGREVKKGTIDEKGIFDDSGNIFVSGNKYPNGLMKRWNHYGIYLNNKWLIKPKYASIKCTINNFYIVKKGDLYGVYDKNGMMIIPLKYKNIEPKANKL